MNKRSYLIIGILIFLIITLPYILAVIMARDYSFSGFLLNPIDGNSYLAKMYEGWSGQWTFTLPYTAENGTGTYLFLFYIFLGHIARILNLQLIFIFHAVRVIASILLYLSLIKFLNIILPDSLRHWYYLLFICLGSGLGWLFSWGTKLTSDFWVAEAYPFLSMFTNPHFPIGILLILWIFMFSIKELGALSFFVVLFSSVLLAVIMPFGWVLVTSVSACIRIWEFIICKKITVFKSLIFMIGGGLILLYQYSVILNDPLLSIWNRQNQTPSPSIFDMFISFSPALILAGWGLYDLYKQKEMTNHRILIVWFALGLFLIYFPFSLQRRFLIGFYLPTACLAIIGIRAVIKNIKINKWIFSSIFLFSVITNLMILLASFLGILTHSGALYLDNDEYNAMQWLKSINPSNAVILCSPEMGNFIPAQAGLRVLYGHPFETVNAEQNKAIVEDYFKNGNPMVLQNTMRDIQISYIFFGPREKKLGNPSTLNSFPVVYKNNTVTIYSYRADVK